MSLQVLKGDTPGQGANTVNACPVEEGILKSSLRRIEMFTRPVEGDARMRDGRWGMYGEQGDAGGVWFSRGYGGEK